MMVTLRLRRRVYGPDAFLSWLRKKKRVVRRYV